MASEKNKFSKADANRLFDLIALSSLSQIKIEDLRKFAEKSKLNTGEDLDLDLLYILLDFDKDGKVSRIDFEKFLGV